MFDWLASNIDKVLIATGAAVVLFWPKIKQAVVNNAGSPKAVPHNHACCCCPPAEPVEVKSKSEWVTEAMSIRGYCEKHDLADGVKACDDLITELVSGKPDKAVVKVTPVKQ